MSNSFSNIHQYIGVKRETSQLLQQDLANALILFNSEFEGIDGQTISRWEGGKVSPSIQRQVLLIEYFGDDAFTILSDQGFQIKQLTTLCSFEKMLDQTLEFPHVLGSHPYADKRLNYERQAVSAENVQMLAGAIVSFQSNLSRRRDIWDKEKIAELLCHASTYAVLYQVKAVLAGHSVVLRIKPAYLDAILAGQLADKDIGIEHLADVGEAGDIFPLSLYGGSREITVDINSRLLAIAAEDTTITALGVKARSEVGIRMLDMMDADCVAFGNVLTAKKEGVKYNGRRYESISYKLSRQKLLASSLTINLSRKLSSDSE
ncbi:MAG: helix-turn-helix transcriptional regulator [Pseudomonadales bacterium]|nr:helix-turn-helix transcriptional regulator [Pseudomonadales bacterium]